jgi:hypothetical protein
VVIFLAILLIKQLFFRKEPSKALKDKLALWFQELKTRIEERFPNQTFHIDEFDPFVIVALPKHPVVGDLRIYDYGNHMIVEINPILHQDFELVGMNSDEGREDLVLDVLLFLENIFEDKIEFYGRPNGCSHRERGQKPRSSLNKLIYGKSTYVWSGPIEEQ